MIRLSDKSRQPCQAAWTMECLNAELTINLGMAIDCATHDSYSSALNSYLTFCRLHNIDIEPTQWTLALYVTFQSTYINPKSVDSYLSGIANQLESHFPDVRSARKSALVSCALQGAKQRFGVPTTCKLPLTRENLLTVCNAYHDNPSHDDILFMTQILTGTECLMRLGELMWPDQLDLRHYRKVSMHHTVSFHTDALSFWLPGHKADQFFEGNRLIVHKSLPSHAYSHFQTYLSSRDFLFCARPELWLHADGTIPSIFPQLYRWAINACWQSNHACRSWHSPESYPNSWPLDFRNVQLVCSKKPLLIRSSFGWAIFSTCLISSYFSKLLPSDHYFSLESSGYYYRHN